MLVSGYVPDDHNTPAFRKLAQNAVKKIQGNVTADQALAYLRQTGLRDFATTAVAEAQSDDIPANARREPIPRPTVIEFSGDVFTARKKVLIPRPFRTVAKLTNPVNWSKFGPFWEGRGSMIPAWDRKNSDSEVQKGEVTERFVVNWNELLVQEFNVRLRVTRRRTEDMIRTDYSLMYEEDDQLLVDQGYGEVKRIPKRPGWACYTGEKTLKFASVMLNLLAPGVMAMFLDGIVVSLNDIFGFRPRRVRARH
jgi:hypothetical protein